MNIIYWTLFPFILTYYTWGMYLAVMTLVRYKDTLSIESKVFAYPLVAVGLVFDVVFNAIVGSLLFLEIPREWLFTKRVSRWNDSGTWRGKAARWVCRHLLDPFDPRGHHCS